MWLTRLWMLMMAVLVAAALALAMVVYRPAMRDYVQTHADQLVYVQDAVATALKLQTRQLIDEAAAWSRDETIVELATLADDSTRDVTELQKRTNQRLAALMAASRIDELKPSLALTVDLRGKQISRVGPGEKQIKAGQDGMIGYPVVSAILRGYKADDTWSYEDRLFIVAGVPIITRNHDRYIGGLIIGFEVTTAVAEQIKKRVPTADVAFYLRGKMVGSTGAAASLSKLPLQFSKMHDEITQKGHSALMTVTEGNTNLGVILGNISGEATQHDAFYAVAMVKPVMTTELMREYGRVLSSDWQDQPWLFIGGIALMLIVISMLLVYWEADRPLSLCSQTLAAVSKGESARVEVNRLPRSVYLIGRMINDILDRNIRRPGQASASNPRESSGLSAVGTGAGATTTARGGRAYNVAGDASAPIVERRSDRPASRASDSDENAGVQPLELLDASGPSSYGSSASSRPPQRSAPAITPLDSISDIGGAEPLEGLSNVDNEPTRIRPDMAGGDEGALAIPNFSTGELSTLGLRESALMPSLKPTAKAPTLANLDDMSSGDMALPPLIPSTSPGLSTVDAPLALPKLNPSEFLGSRAQPATAAALPIIDNRKASSGTADGILSLPSLGPASAPTSAPLQPLRSSPQPHEEEDDTANYFATFQEFVAVKQQCGEPTDNLTYEKFLVKLQKNRESLIERYACKKVKFSVYVKDGKAALKAVPIKD